MDSQYISFDGLDKTLQVNYYETLKTNLQTMVYYLNKCNNSLSSFDLDLSEYYMVDDSNVSNVDVSSIKANVSSKINYINNYVIPEINNKILEVKNSL